MKENNRVAVFIDAENISAKYADRLLQEAANYGDVIVRRVFADWSSSNVAAWKEVVNKHSLIAEQQFSAVKGKNSSDISLIINVLVVLFEKDIDVFCLASSDSDFTRLVQELREREKSVVGLGLKQTSQSFVNAFSEFIYLDNSDEKEVKNTALRSTGAKTDGVNLDPSRRAALKEIIDKLIEDDGWALYARIATEMKNKYSDFVPKNYNCRSLKELIGRVIDSIGDYEIKTGNDGTTMFLIPARTLSKKTGMGGAVNDEKIKTAAKKNVKKQIKSKNSGSARKYTQKSGKYASR
ncbi:MAG: NYN domain-containing protein [Candidatus Borkfalkiaceae bacterium]|nr:NYN domain-containing protein [Christensenellaceae bacterium]